MGQFVIVIIGRDSLIAFTSENFITFYFTISKNYFINYVILFYNILNIPTFILQYNILK